MSYYTDGDDGDYDSESRIRFAGPGSALRAATRRNPRNKPCPGCGAANRLTSQDVGLGYQCNRCADRAERGYDY